MNCRLSVLLIALLFMHLPANAMGQSAKLPPKATPTPVSPAAIDDTPPIQDDVADDDSEDDEDPYSDEAVNAAGQGIFGNLRFGPAVALEIPHIFAFGIDGKYRRKVGFGAMVSTYKTKSSDIHAAISSFDVRGRYHVYEGALYLGANIGKQTVVVTSTTPVVNVNPAASAVALSDATIEATARSNYVSPHIGWQSEFDSGLTLAFELGVQFVFSAVVDTQVTVSNAAADPAIRDTAAFKNAATEVDDKVQTWAKKPLPYITLLRAGWLF